MTRRPHRVHTHRDAVAHDEDLAEALPGLVGRDEVGEQGEEDDDQRLACPRGRLDLRIAYNERP